MVVIPLNGVSMNIRLSSILCLFLIWTPCVFSQETGLLEKTEQEISFIDKTEQTLWRFWSNLFGVTKIEAGNAADLTEKGTGLAANLLGFWKNHPKIAKTSIVSIVAISGVRAYQYKYFKEHLDRARVFCRSQLPGTAEPDQRRGWLVYDHSTVRNLTLADLRNRLNYCNELMGKLSGPSWLSSWLPRLAIAEGIQGFNPNNLDPNNLDDIELDNIVQALNHENIARIITNRSQAIGCPQYYSWTNFFGIWKNRLQATKNQLDYTCRWLEYQRLRLSHRLGWAAQPQEPVQAEPGSDVGFLTSLASGIFTPYDGEATLLMVKLYKIKKELQDEANRRPTHGIYIH